MLISAADVDAVAAMRPEIAPFYWHEGKFENSAKGLIEKLCDLYESTNRDGAAFRDMLPIYEHTDPDYLPTGIPLDMKLQYLFDSTWRPAVRPRFPKSIEDTLVTHFSGTEAGRGVGQSSRLRVAGPDRTAGSDSAYCRQD